MRRKVSVGTHHPALVLEGHLFTVMEIEFAEGESSLWVTVDKAVRDCVESLQKKTLSPAEKYRDHRYDVIATYPSLDGTFWSIIDPVDRGSWDAALTAVVILWKKVM